MDSLVSNNLKSLLKNIIGFDYNNLEKNDLIKESLNNLLWSIDFLIKSKSKNILDHKISSLLLDSIDKIWINILNENDKIPKD